MKRIDRVLDFAFDQREIVKAAQVGQALRRWDEIVGEELARRSWPDRYEAGTVYVAAAGSAWSQELRMKKTLIMDRIAQMLGTRALVSDVRFGVRKLPSRPEAPTPPRPTPKAVVEMESADSPAPPRVFTIPSPAPSHSPLDTSHPSATGHSPIATSPDPQSDIRDLQSEVDEVRQIVQRILARAKDDS